MRIRHSLLRQSCDYLWRDWIVSGVGLTGLFAAEDYVSDFVGQAGGRSGGFYKPKPIIRLFK